MPTCSAQTLTNFVGRNSYCLTPVQYETCPECNRRIRNTKYAIRNTRRGFTLTELIVVVLIVSLFVLLVQVNLFGLLRKNTFRGQVQEFVSTMQMAAGAAAESDRRYEVIIDLSEQGYLLREITTPDLSEVLEEEIIVENYFSDNCYVAYVLFDDGDYTNEGRAKFRAGHSGWQYGGIIVLLDEDEQAYSVVVNRINRIVTLKEGEAEFLEPRMQSEVPF